MEAGRALQRGLVNPQRTTLITSTHRVYSMTEKTAMADGRVNQDQLLKGTQAAAQQWIGLNFLELAERCSAPIGPALLGAVAASGRLPFGREQFESAIQRQGVGVASSLRAFAAAYDAVRLGPSPSAAARKLQPGPRLAALAKRIATEFDAAAHDTLLLGVARLADYQDIGYAQLYLNRLADLQAKSRTTAAQWLPDAAKHLAVWMSYEDVVRVADLKTRRSRFQRISTEVRQQDGQLIQIHEYLHPRVEEIADTLPAAWGRWLLSSDTARRWVKRWLEKGRMVQTSSVRGYLLLYLLAALRPLRPRSMRYALEQTRIMQWLQHIEGCLPQQPELALEIIRTQQLIKGYSDTHQRGWRNYSLVIEALPLLSQRPDAPARLADLRKAALSDEAGTTLQGALQALNPT